MRQTYFGTGETFLFHFDGDNGKRYQWVNLKQSGDKDISKAEQHARELFMSAQKDMISIGGG